MDLGQKLLELRKSKGLSQEEVAEKLNVTRQTVSKWETDQSTPDFDKIGPLCDLYEISADSLLRNIEKTEEKENKKESLENVEIKKTKKAHGIGIGIFLYALACAWVMVAIPVMQMNPIVASAIFLLICAIATYVIIFSCIVYKTSKTKKEEHASSIVKSINKLLALITLIIYLLLSFITYDWHITWILWLVYAIAAEIVRLIFMLRSDTDEK